MDDLERPVWFMTMEGHERPISIRSNTERGGHIQVPYLTWNRRDVGVEVPLGESGVADSEGGPLFLLLDNRLGYDVPATFTRQQEEALVEFIANAIAIGAGYASIYYTKRKMPFRG